VDTRRRLARVIGGLYAILMYAFLYAPIVVLMVMSFNKSQYNAFPLVWSLKWYRAFIADGRLIASALNSLWLGVTDAAVATAFGTALALGMTRFEFPGKRLLSSLVTLPLIIPWIIMAIATLLLFHLAGIGRSYPALLIGHVTVTLPYVVLVVTARLQGLDAAVEEAARTLGANEWVTFWKVTLPNIAPGILAGVVLAFMVSFDNFVISYFLTPTGVSTLPIEIYSSIKFGYTPEINAIATVILLTSMVLVVVTSRLIGSATGLLGKN
jgi:spermidine/putrescine transport system permease protein